MLQIKSIYQTKKKLRKKIESAMLMSGVIIIIGVII